MPWTGRLAAKQPHPDRRERIENVVSILRSELSEPATRVDHEPASEAQLARVHTREYVDDVRAWADRRRSRPTPETGGNRETYRAAAVAAGGAIAAAERAVDDGLPTVL